MAETPEKTEEQPLSIFITGADQGAGLALLSAASRAGCKVVGTSSSGTEGAVRIRKMGGIPTYPDLTQGGEIRSMLLMAKPDVIVHCAPQSLGGIPQIAQDYNAELRKLLIGTQTLAAVAAEVGVQKIIHLSYAALYGHTSTPATEDQETHAENAFFDAALQAEAAVLDGAVPAVVVRAGSIFGGWHDATRKLAQILTDGRSVLSGHHPISWVHEDDLASALLLLAQSDVEAGSIFNVALDETASPNEFARQFGVEFGPGEPSKIPGFLIPLRTSELQREMMELHTPVDSSKIKALGWEPQYPSLKAGIDRSLLIWRAEEADNILPAPTEDGDSVELATT
jgi:nucleoside-diphosphate-sugar epimerase